MIIEPLEFNPKELSIADIRTLAEEKDRACNGNTGARPRAQL